MSRLPLPPTLHDHVAPRGGTNRSLAFDRGFDRYDGRWSIESGDKQEWLREFRDRFSEPADFKPFVERRKKAMEGAGAHRIRLISQTRLVLGLGLPHPTETALLLDRLTGCPYLPGSSVKGLLRETAALVATGELDTEEPGDRTLWSEGLDRLFGPHLGEGVVPAKGELLIHDAFPDTWPELEIDVLTPHFQPYYGDNGDEAGEPPADWHDPVPVAFLTVRRGSGFSFWIGHRGGDGAEAELAAAERLLVTALDWLGIGGKTSSGYGLFGRDMPGLAGKSSRPGDETGPEDDPGNGGDPPQPPDEPRTQEVLWQGVTLELDKGKPTIFKDNKGKTKAQAGKRQLPSKLMKRLKKNKELRVDAWVLPRSGAQPSRIVQIEELEE